MPLYRDAARRTVDNVFRLKGPTLSAAVDIIERIATKKRASEYCPAFFSQISVATDGSVYPCFMFIGNKYFDLGNLLTDEFPSVHSIEVINRYFKEFGTEPSGTRRWYGSLFGGCIAGEFVTAGTLGFRDECVRLAMIEECLLRVALNSRRFQAHANATSPVASSNG